MDTRAQWLTEWAEAVGRDAPAELDLPALAATLAEVAQDEGDPSGDELDLLGDVLLDLDRSRAAWQAHAAHDDDLRAAAARLGALFRRDAGPIGPELAAARREAVARLLALAGGLAEHRLRQVEWARQRREKRSQARHRELPLQLDAGERGVPDAPAALEAAEAAEGVAADLRAHLKREALAALAELLSDGGSGTANDVARRHGLSAPTLSRAKARLGRAAGEALRALPEGAHRPFWDALERALAAG